MSPDEDTPLINTPSYTNRFSPETLTRLDGREDCHYVSASHLYFDGAQTPFGDHRLS